MKDQLYQLSQPIPKRYIKPPAPGKYGDYIPHYIITQRLLAVLGPFDWRLIQVIRGDSSGRRKVDGKLVDVTATDIVVGAVYQLGVDVEGFPVVIQEIGQCDNAWKEPDDAARLKKAASDALKRCAMRLGLGLHMWCKTPDEYFLSRVLREGLDDDESAEVVTLGIESEDDTEAHVEVVSAPKAAPQPEPEAPQAQADNVTVTEPIASEAELAALTESEKLIEAEADLWADLYILLSNEHFGAGTKAEIGKRVARLHELCERLGLWPADSMTQLVRAWCDGKDWSDLDKATMADYAMRAWAKAKSKVEEMEKAGR